MIEPKINTRVAAKPAKASNRPSSAIANIRYQVGEISMPSLSMIAAIAKPTPATGSSSVVEPSIARRYAPSFTTLDSSGEIGANTSAKSCVNLSKKVNHLDLNQPSLSPQFSSTSSI